MTTLCQENICVLSVHENIMFIFIFDTLQFYRSEYVNSDPNASIMQYFMANGFNTEIVSNEPVLRSCFAHPILHQEPI